MGCIRRLGSRLGRSFITAVPTWNTSWSRWSLVFTTTRPPARAPPQIRCFLPKRTWHASSISHVTQLQVCHDSFLISNFKFANSWNDWWQKRCGILWRWRVRVRLGLTRKSGVTASTSAACLPTAYLLNVLHVWSLKQKQFPNASDSQTFCKMFQGGTPLAGLEREYELRPKSWGPRAQPNPFAGNYF